MPVTVPSETVAASSLVITTQTYDTNYPDSDPNVLASFTLDSGKLAMLEDSDVDALTAVYTARAEAMYPDLTVQHVRQWNYSALTIEDPVDDYAPAAPGQPDGEAAPDAD